MADLTLRNVNLNLIPVLRALLREQSVSRAAAALGRSPPAISAALSQLRAVLADPLFVRVGSRLQPTAKAARLAGPLEALHQQLTTFFQAEEFQSERSQRKFVVASADIIVQLMGAILVRLLRENALEMSIQFVDVRMDLPDAMAAREIDFALLPEMSIDGMAPAPLRYSSLGVVAVDGVLMSSRNPLANCPSLRMRDVIGHKQVGYRANPVLLKGRPRDWIDELDVAVGVAQHLVIPSLVEDTDLIALVTKAVVETEIGRRNLAIVDLKDPFRMNVGLSWSAVLDGDPAHRWFRTMVIEKMSGLRAVAAEKS
jgi:DNA-binding transcriptional LysR family regulator